MRYQPRIDIPLFLERAAILRSSRATASIDGMSFKWEWSRDPPSSEVSVTGPDDEATTAFFARVREFDVPGKMIYVAKYIDHLQAAATGPLREIVEHARLAHRDVGRVAYRWEEHVLGKGATPREVWELWTYGYVLHTDPAKREVYSGLDELGRGMARWVSHVYAADLYRLVSVIAALLEDPDLKSTKVSIAWYGTRPEFRDIVGKDQVFEKAIISLVDDLTSGERTIT